MSYRVIEVDRALVGTADARVGFGVCAAAAGEEPEVIDPLLDFVVDCAFGEAFEAEVALDVSFLRDWVSGVFSAFRGGTSKMGAVAYRFPGHEAFRVGFADAVELVRVEGGVEGFDLGVDVLFGEVRGCFLSSGGKLVWEWLTFAPVPVRVTLGPLGVIGPV